MTHPLAAFLQGLTGDEETPGFQGGYKFRQGITDRKRKLAENTEDRDYLQARRLREDVGFQLEQRVNQGQLDAQGRSAANDQDRRRRVAAAAAQIREQYGRDPKYKGLTLLPDEDLVREFGDILTNPQRFERPGGYTSTHRTEARQDLTSVEKQVDDTRSDLSRAEREMPTRPPMAAYDPSVARQFTADSSAAAVGVNLLRQRADSLGIVRDSIAADVQGRPFHRPGQTGKKPEDRWEELVGQGVSPAEATRRVKQEFRLP